MTNRHSEMSHQANAIWGAVNEARRKGFVLIVDAEGFVDLMDKESGESTPVTAAKVIK